MNLIEINEMGVGFGHTPPPRLLAIANTFSGAAGKCLIGKDFRALANANRRYFLNAAGSSEWRFRRE